MPAGPEVPPTPGTLAELASQLHEIRTQAADIQDVVVEVDERLTALELRAGDRQGTGDGSEPAAAGETKPDPVSWGGCARVGDLEQLAAWVDWLCATYDLNPETAILPCWPAHPGVVEELAALHSAWRSAARSSGLTTAAQSATGEDSEAMIYWHDRWMHPCLPRLRGVFQAKQCREGHRDVRVNAGTDTDLLAKALVDVAARTHFAPDVDLDTGELGAGPATAD